MREYRPEILDKRIPQYHLELIGFNTDLFNLILGPSGKLIIFLHFQFLKYHLLCTEQITFEMPKLFSMYQFLYLFQFLISNLNQKWV